MHSRPFCLFSYLFCAGTDPAHWLECSSLLSAAILWRKRKLAPSCQMLMGMPCPWPFAAWLSLPPPAFPPHLPSSATTDGPHAAQCVHSLGSFCHLCVHRDLLTFVKHMRTWLKNMKWPQNIVIEYPYKDIFLHNYVL